MISRISGEIADIKHDALTLSTGGISYEVMIPSAVMKSVSEDFTIGSSLEIITYHYYQMDKSKAMPMLIGFMNAIEKEFFEKFISVSGVGPKAACKALSEPFSVIAGAIDSGDVPFLKKLPGIGEQKAKLIVAKLQDKVGKFGLIQDGDKPVSEGHDDIKAEALSVLAQLQYKKTEAEAMVQKAIDRNPEIKTSEELLNEVYRERLNG